MNNNVRRILQRKAALIRAKKKQLQIFIGYVLKLRSGKWYVGISARGTERLYEHFCGYGAKWTKLHKPVAVQSIEFIPGGKNAADEWERETTLSYMEDKGFENVRGAGWCHIEQRVPASLLDRLCAEGSMKNRVPLGAQTSRRPTCITDKINDVVRKYVSIGCQTDAP